MTVDEANGILADADLLADAETVQFALDRMAREIGSELRDKSPVVICIMNGGLIFTGQLLPRLAFPLQVDYVHATRYGSGTAGGDLTWLVRPTTQLSGRGVLLLDDILDEGITLTAIADWCMKQGAEKVWTAVLVDKQHKRKVRPGIQADFTGIVTEDRFLFGCGLDYKGYWRNAPGIYGLKSPG